MEATTPPPIIIEPRTALWAVAEVSWEDSTGESRRTPGILEDTSSLGACLRVKHPFPVGAKLTVKWHREQFSAVARNCRRDGGDFLLGVRRETEKLAATAAATQKASRPAADEHKTGSPAAAKGALPGTLPGNSRDQYSDPAPQSHVQVDPPSSRIFTESNAAPSDSRPQSVQPEAKAAGETTSNLRRDERKVMESKTIFPKFWRRQPASDESAKSASTETPTTAASASTGETLSSDSRGDLLGYEDIYRAAGIMIPASRYSIHKVVEMLHSERIRELSPDIKRASVLMALEASGTSLESLIEDATRRRSALESYEASQRKRLEEFEAGKTAENAQMEAELNRIRAHYAERMQNNLAQVAQEKETLRNWRMAVQHEGERIAEVLELCGKQPATSLLPGRVPAEKPPVELAADAARRPALRPSLLSGD